MEPATRQRRVWIFSDLHIGFEVDGKDGAEWTRLAVQDIARHVAPLDYVLVLGDMTHRFQPEQFQAYRDIRDSSGIPNWFEIPGNHDYRGIAAGHYDRFVRPERRYVIEDGNLVWVMFGAECSNAVGVVKSATRAWLEQTLSACRDRNVIVCSHQLVAHTVRRTDPSQQYWRVLHPLRWMEKFRTEHPVPLWLGGHEHGPPRDDSMMTTKDGTVFINIAAVSHIYGMKASTSFVFEMTAGETSLHARCRNHDTQQFVEEHSARISLPFPLEFSQPRLIPPPPPEKS